MAALVLTIDNSTEFLRRVLLKNQINKSGLLHWRAFNDGDPRMLLTYRNNDLRTDLGVRNYHAFFSERVGTALPAILWLSFVGLTQQIEPPLEPQSEPDNTDPVYGHLHCSTPAPSDKPHMQLLAKLVNDGQFGGVLLRI